MTKVLLVEDDINLRDLYSARLSAEEIEVFVASDGEEGLTMATSIKPDLIILDVMMPKISGFDVLDILRQTPGLEQVKVIMMTALSSEQDRQRGDRLGVSAYLVKSQVTLEDVVETAMGVLNNSINGVPPSAFTQS
ncbi:response regulator [Candidatus Saccharibacteria bacterium]|nr:response regulator [Candidatus Saccharibacteria bacterium]